MIRPDWTRFPPPQIKSPTTREGLLRERSQLVTLYSDEGAVSPANPMQPKDLKIDHPKLPG